MNIFSFLPRTTYNDGSEFFIQWMPQGIEAKFSCRIISFGFFFFNTVFNVTTDVPSFETTRPCCRVPDIRAVLVRPTCVPLSLTTTLVEKSLPVMGLHFLFFEYRQHLLKLALCFLQHEISQKIYDLTLLGHFHSLIRTMIPEISSEYPASWQGKRVPWGLSRQTRKISRQWAGGYETIVL